VVARFVEGAFALAAKAVGQTLLEAGDALVTWFRPAFASLRGLMGTLALDVDVDLPTQLLLVAIVFGCPMLAWMLCAVALGLAWTCGRPSDQLFSIVLQLGVAGLSISLTIHGFAAVVESMNLPILNVRVEPTALLTQSVLANVLVLVSYANRVFDRLVPLHASHQP